MRRCAAVFGLLFAAAVCRADTASPLLGERFAGQYEVSFRPFAEAKTVDRQGPGEIARFARPDKNWQLTFTRLELADASPLKDTPRPNGETQAGFLSTVVNKLRATDPAADVLRNEVIDLGDLRIGVMAAVSHDKSKPVLLQEALAEITPNLYYTLIMTCPLETGDAQKSTAARDAAATFKAILDSIERVDLTAVKQEQDERLFRTRALFVQWNRAKLMSVLKPERYLRYKHEGKDIGYAYVVEQPADNLPRNDHPDEPATTNPAGPAGLRVGMRTHVLGDAGKVVDTESWMFVTFDRQHEVWSSVNIVTDPAGRSEKERSNWSSEVGASDMSRERVFNAGMTHDDFTDADRRSKKDKDADSSFHWEDRYKLSVRTEGRVAIAEPLERQLPPFYLPEALESLLGRIVPRNNPTGYLFAVYNSPMRQVMLRYVDVLPEATVKIDGKEHRAVGVAERLGHAGSVTTHYYDVNGQYLGSVNNDSKLEILPTDRETLKTLWKDVNLRKPAGTK